MTNTTKTPSRGLTVFAGRGVSLSALATAVVVGPVVLYWERRACVGSNSTAIHSRAEDEAVNVGPDVSVSHQRQHIWHASWQDGWCDQLCLDLLPGSLAAGLPSRQDLPVCL